MNKKIILFELNEVPFRVLNDYCAQYPESSLAKLSRQSLTIETVSPDSMSLHPWSTWPTLHRGINTEKHMLTNLGQDLTEVDKEYPPIWKILANEGINTGLGGSLHSWPMPEDLANYSFYLPDTFATDAQAYPYELEIFQKFNLAMVDKSPRNVSSGVAMKEALDVVKNYRKLGFKTKTIYTIAKQLVQEFTNPARKGRRRVMQSVLAFDVFMKQLEQKKPDFTTFFTNHVASSQHRYWAASYPKDFDKNEYEKEWVNTYKGEINFALDIASSFIEQLMQFTAKYPEYNILLTTSMGQAAADGSIVERQVYVGNKDLLMKSLGVEPHDYSQRRAMVPRFASIVNKDKLNLLRKNLENFKVADESLHFVVNDDGYCMMHFGQLNLNKEEEYVVLNDKRYTFSEMGLKNSLIEDTAGSTGYHIPEGMMLLYDPQKIDKNQKIKTSIATTEITPMILQNYSISVPEYMSASTNFIN